MGIGHLLQRKPHGLSGGERQRISLAQALCLDPEILLMDEPLSALDQQRKLEILPFLERLKQEAKIPIIYVSHASDEVARLADYLVAMQEGKVIAQGALSDVLSDLNLPIRLGEDAGAIVHASVGAIDSQWHLARMDFAGGSVWTKDPNLPLGTAVRVRILARDVSLASAQPSLTSIQNLLQGIVVAISDDTHPSQLLVRVLIGQSALIARMTKRSAALLNIEIGQSVWVQVKSVALL
jgi:molybdate transport system ATP-binding protein